MKELDDFIALVDQIRPEKELTEEQSHMLIGLLMSGKSEVNDVIDSDFEDLKPVFGLQVFLKRLELLSTIKITLGAAVMLALAIENAGKAVMYAYFLHRKLAPETVVTLDVFSKDLFPWGMFSEKQLEEMWVANKINGEEKLKEAKALRQYSLSVDSLLDYEQTWVKEEVKV